MKLKDIIAGAGIITFAAGAGEANAEIKDYQVQPIANAIIFNTLEGNTLGGIANYLDNRFGKKDDPNDAFRNLEWRTKSGDIFYFGCGNRISNINLIKADERILFKGEALEDIDPNYGKESISNNDHEYVQKIKDKNIQVKTDSKTRKNIIAKSDISKNRSKTPKGKIGFYFDGNFGYIIPKGTRESFGGGDVRDINAGLDLGGLQLGIGYRNWDVDGNKYSNYRGSLFGLLYEDQSGREDLDVSELYAQLMLKLRDPINGIGIGLGGGVKRMSIKDTVKASGRGWYYGESWEDNINDQYDGWFWAVDLEKMLGENASIYIRVRGDIAESDKIYDSEEKFDEDYKDKTYERLKLDSTSAGVGFNVRF